MSPFDVAAGLVLLVSCLIGWFRGGAREVAGVAALAVAAVVAFMAVRYTGPIAAHLVKTPWLANVAAILSVFVVLYIVLRIIASGITRRIHDSSLLGGLDSLLGGAFGLARALIVLGLGAMVITAVTPPDKQPGWIRDAFLFPLSAASAQALKTLAPRGVAFAETLAPAMSNAMRSAGATNAAENRDYNDTSKTPLKVRVERSQ